MTQLIPFFSTSLDLKKKKKYIPTNICGRISVITTFSLSIVSGLGGGGGRSESSLSLKSSVRHSIKCGYSVFTASKPPKIFHKSTRF